MKKMYKYILIITLMMFGFIGEVRAENLKECEKINQECNLICSYTLQNSDKINLYYNLSQDKYGYSINGTGSILNNEFKTSYKGYISFDDQKKLKNGECPTKIYYNNGMGTLGNKFCFDFGETDNDPNTNTAYCLTDPEKRFDASEEVGDKEIVSVFDKEKYDGRVKLPFDIKKPDCYDKGTCYPVCYYEQEDYGKYAVIYYKSGNSIENQLFVMSSAFDGTKFLTYGDKLSGRAYISEDDRAKIIVNSKDEKIICPKNFYHDTNFYDDVCFDNNGWCETIKNFESDEYVEDTEVENIDGDAAQDVVDIMNIDKKNILSCSDATKRIEENLSSDFKITEICSYAKTSSPTDEVRQFFIVSNGSYFRYFYYTYNISDGGSGSIREIVDKNDKNLNFSNYYTCSGIDNVYTAGNDNSTWSDDKRSYKTDVRFSRMCHYNYAEGIYTDKINPDDVKDCASLLGVDLVNEINSWLLYIKIAVPIIIIVMGSLDFGKAFISSDEDAMKKAQKKFIMRLIIGMVIFFIPTIVKALLNVANQVWGNVINDTCGITF